MLIIRKRWMCGKNLERQRELFKLKKREGWCGELAQELSPLFEAYLSIH